MTFKSSSVLKSTSRRAAITRLMLVVLALSACLICSPGAPAALQHPGDLDPSFGSGGLVLTSAGQLALCRTVLIQPDGKIIAAGMGGNQSVIGFAAFRYNTNGTLDTNFGSGGIALHDVGGAGESGGTGALQADGKIVVAGARSTGLTEPLQQFALTRFNADGSLDAGFGSGGVALATVGNDAGPNSVAIQADGKIVAGGLTVTGNSSSFSAIGMARFDSHGVLDPGFGNGGTVVMDITPGAGIEAIAIQPDGKIVAGGFGDSPVERFNADGTLDSSFGLGGFAPSPVPFNDFLAFGVALQADGKIVAAGSVFNNTKQVFGVVRYNHDGSLDSGFGSGGLTTADLGDNNFASGVAIGPGGNIIAVGQATVLMNSGFPPQKFAVLALQPNGLPNPAFGIGGMVTTDFGHPAAAGSVAIQSDGNIVVGGGAAFSESSAFPFQVALARYVGLGAAPVFCLRDNNSPLILELTQTGDYFFKNCATGQTLSGTGTVRLVNSVLMLTDNRPDRRITATYYLNQLNGSALITLIPAPGVFQTTRIVDTVPGASCSCQ